MKSARTVIAIGLDGLEPKIVESLLATGALPHLKLLADGGGYSRITTTYPAQTPVAWSTFATGTNPGGHGIFDFIRRDPTTYLPEVALNRYVQKSAFLPPKAENLRRGTPFWELLSDAGIPSSVLRFPCTYPPDNLKGRMLSGMGVPDVRGSFGTPTFYTSDHGATAHESEFVVPVHVDVNGNGETDLIGPRDPKSGKDAKYPIELKVDRFNKTATVFSRGEPNVLEVREGHWSDWLKVKFKLGRLQSVVGMVRFYLMTVDTRFELYASPVNFDPKSPVFPISSPWDYAGELAGELGTYYTTGMVEEHTGLNNGRIDEAAYLAQCETVLKEREAMMVYELERLTEGFFYCLFDTPDRVQHMFWRFLEPDHPANGSSLPSEWVGVIEDHYRRCDAIVGRALEYADDESLVLVLSDHGFGTYRREFHLNAWLLENGFLSLRHGVDPGEGAGDLLQNVDWERTKAYSVGFAGVYLNLQGREGAGILSQGAAEDVQVAIAAGLTGLRDSQTGRVPIRSVKRRTEVYAGDYAAESPDLVLNFAEGYRSSSITALGGIPSAVFEDNVKPWSGDHVVDPDLVPGVLFSSRPFRNGSVNMLDMAPTILRAFGVSKGPKMEGDSILA
jgi:predicted AlkP superfamily phosphohydrolase/phosphomutase